MIGSLGGEGGKFFMVFGLLKNRDLIKNGMKTDKKNITEKELEGFNKVTTWSNKYKVVDILVYVL